MQNAFRSTVLAALLLVALPATQAAEQFWNVSGTLDSGHYAGQSFAGQFSFDDVVLAGSGEEWLAVDSLALNFAGTPFTLANADAPAEVYFIDGAFLGLSFSASTLEPMVSFVPGASSLNQAFVAYDTALGFSGAGDAIFAPVPEPETYALFLAGLGLLGMVARRRRAS